MRKLLFTALVSCCFLGSHAQQSTYTGKDYARYPVWISMIKDTATNYFEAEKAFNTYFEHHEKPAGEDDEIGEHESREKYPSKKEQRKLQADNHMRMEVKKYERWHDKMRPYVQAGGAILTPSQRLQIWKQQQSTKK